MERRLAVAVRFVFRFSVAILLVLVAGQVLHALQPEQAKAISAQSGRPLLALATRETCPPCQALKHHLASDESVRQLADKYVVLYMDKESSEFQTFLSQHPAEYQGVPMVFVLRPDGASLYGQSGGMTADALKELLQFGLSESGKALTSEQQVKLADNFNASNRYLQQGELLAALRMTNDGAIENCFAEIAVKSTAMRTSVLDEIANRLSKLDGRMLGSETMHGAAFRLAEFRDGLHDGPHRETAAAILTHYTNQKSTRMAVAQGLELVEARKLERVGSFNDALARYRQILSLDESTPTADHALQKIPIIKARIRRATASRTN